MADLLVLWDVDYTLLSAGGLGNRLYEAVFKDLFGRDLTAIAPKAGRTDRAILLDTLALAGVAEPQAHVDDFLAALARQVTEIDGSAAAHVHALPGAAAAIASLAGAGLRQSVLTGNIRPLAALKLAAAGLGEHLDLDVGAYGDMHEVRAELVPVARRAARARALAESELPSASPCRSTRRSRSPLSATCTMSCSSSPASSPKRPLCLAMADWRCNSSRSRGACSRHARAASRSGNFPSAERQAAGLLPAVCNSRRPQRLD